MTETEQIWDKLLEHKPRIYDDSIQARLEYELIKAEVFCSHPGEEIYTEDGEPIG